MLTTDDKPCHSSAEEWLDVDPTTGHAWTAVPVKCPGLALATSVVVGFLLYIIQ